VGDVGVKDSAMMIGSAITNISSHHRPEGLDSQRGGQLEGGGEGVRREIGGKPIYIRYGSLKNPPTERD
jgi:hypothetical protein